MSWDVGRDLYAIMPVLGFKARDFYSQDAKWGRGRRLPSVVELASLLDNPALPTGHAFSKVQPTGYWSATTHAADPSIALAAALIPPTPGVCAVA